MPTLNTALPSIDTATTALFSTIQSGVPVTSVVTQATPSMAGSARVTAQYSAILPQYIVSASAQLQAPPTTAAAAPTAGTAPMAPTAGSSLFASASALNIQGTPFQGAGFCTKFTALCPDGTTCNIIEHLQRERQQFEAWKLEVESKTPSPSFSSSTASGTGPCYAFWAWSVRY